MDLSELFWQASLEELQKGYAHNKEREIFTCLICGKQYEKGVIYPNEGVYYEAEKAVSWHIAKEHTSMFDYLINLDKKMTGLTDHQKKILEYFYEGKSDNEIVSELGGGSTSTIRNHRFTFREKEKQAKIYLAIMGLLSDGMQDKHKLINIHRTATMVDERYAVTEEENEEVLKKYFKKGLDGPLSDFPVKQKKKVIILKNLIKRFEPGQKYTEKEVNEILKKAYDDYVTLRRYMIEYGFLDRVKDGSSYWIKT